jgi:uncharacterized protein
LDAYRVNIIGLSFNTHQFHFDFGDEFFKRFDTGLVSNGQFSVNIELDKRETFIETSFSINGKVKLVCDRSLEPFDYPINLNERIIFKYGEEDREISEDLIMITRGTDSLELGQYIYEFIGLAIPMKKLHPKFQQESDDDTIVYSSEEEKKGGEQEIDPRWEILKKLNKN